MASVSSTLSVQVRQVHPNPVVAQFDCDGGEIMALVGPSGSGKSTLLRLIAGLTRPDQGRIVCGEKVWLNTSTKEFCTPQIRHVGYVPQHYGLFPHMTAYENVTAGLTHVEHSDRQRIALQWLDHVRLVDLKDRLASQLSGGQQQRVAVARALARRPAALLLDEPFSAIDGVTREELYLLLARLKQQLSIPIIMVTHDLNEAVLLANRMALIVDGQVLQVGTPKEVISHPINEQAARQVGIRNFIDGQASSHDFKQQITWVRTEAITFASPYRPDIAIGSQVRWVIPHSGIRVRAMFHNELAGDQNRIQVTVEELLTLGNTVQLKAKIKGTTVTIYTYLSGRLAVELRLAPGRETEVIMQQHMIHILNSTHTS